MEEEKQLAGEDRLSGEIVEVYRQPLPGEVNFRSRTTS